MSANTSIEWTDRSWNPVRGCSVISPGCVNCYAMKQAHRFSGYRRIEGPGLMQGPYYGLTKQTKAGPQWTGVVRTVDDALLEPLSWRKPARVFVNSMSDLFHEDVPDEFIDRVFAVMALAPQHTFQILTKRPERMRGYLTTPDRETLIARQISILPLRRPYTWEEARSIIFGIKLSEKPPTSRWPLPNVWLGVSVENQHFADERIPLLLQTPAAVRFISAEPLLGPVTVGRYVARAGVPGQCADIDGYWYHDAGDPKCGLCRPALDWVIVGGESRPGARPFDIAWARSIVQQCKAAGVPVFIKQLGRVPQTREFVNAPERNGFPLTDRPALVGHRMLLNDKKGGDMSEWPDDLRVREFPKAVA